MQFRNAKFPKGNNYVDPTPLHSEMYKGWKITIVYDPSPYPDMDQRRRQIGYCAELQTDDGECITSQWGFYKSEMKDAIAAAHKRLDEFEEDSDN